MSDTFKINIIKSYSTQIATTLVNLLTSCVGRPFKSMEDIKIELLLRGYKITSTSDNFEKLFKRKGMLIGDTEKFFQSCGFSEKNGHLMLQVLSDHELEHGFTVYQSIHQVENLLRPYGVVFGDDLPKFKSLADKHGFCINYTAPIEQGSHELLDSFNQDYQEEDALLEINQKKNLLETIYLLSRLIKGKTFLSYAEFYRTSISLNLEIPYDQIKTHIEDFASRGIKIHMSSTEQDFKDREITNDIGLIEINKKMHHTRNISPDFILESALKHGIWLSREELKNYISLMKPYHDDKDLYHYEKIFAEFKPSFPENIFQDYFSLTKKIKEMGYVSDKITSYKHLIEKASIVCDHEQYREVLNSQLENVRSIFKNDLRAFRDIWEALRYFENILGASWLINELGKEKFFKTLDVKFGEEEYLAMEKKRGLAALERGIVLCQEKGIGTHLNPISEKDFGILSSHYFNYNFFAENASILSRAGIFLQIKDNKIKITDEWKYLIRQVKRLEISPESTEALAELGNDFFNRSIVIYKIPGGTIEYIRLYSGIITPINDESRASIIHSAISTLILENKSDFTMIELKLEIMTSGYYFAEKTIIAYLSTIVHDDIPTYGTLEQRVRFAMRCKKLGLPSVEFVNVLPEINISEDETLHVIDTFKNPAVFLQLWESFVLNDIIKGNKSKLPIDSYRLTSLWEGTLTELINKYDKNESLKQLYLLNAQTKKDISILGFKGFSALLLFGLKDINTLPKNLSTLKERLHIFFLWAASQGYTLCHPKYILLNGSMIKSWVVPELLDNHSIQKTHETAINSKVIDYTVKKRLLAQSNAAHMIWIAAASRKDADFISASSEHISDYCAATDTHARFTGAASHSVFFLNLLFAAGNKNAIETINHVSIREYFEEALKNQKKSHINIAIALSLYHQLIQEMINVIEQRLEVDQISQSSARSHTRYLIFLLEFLSTCATVTTREQMQELLNPIIKKDGLVRLYDYAKNVNKLDYYVSATATYRMLFSNILSKEFHGLYPETWVLKKKITFRKIIRQGLEQPILDTLRYLSLANPPKLVTEYAFLKTAPNGEHIDLSWWTYDFSPIPVFCHWLITKVPRRMVHVRWLDVNQFFVEDDNKIFSGLYFNTDKNTKNPGLFISAVTCQLLFTQAELELLKKYVEYIRLAYSYMKPVKYKNGNVFQEIMPLFPHHMASKNEVIIPAIINGYHIKLMFLTQMHIREQSINGTLDEYYNKDLRQAKKDQLSQINLVFEKKGKKRSSVNSLDIFNESETKLLEKYTTESGIHNLRHAGATALLHMGLSLSIIREVTGHSTENILYLVYLHAKHEELASTIKKYAPELESYFGTPTENGNSIIRQTLLPLIESSDVKAVEKTLKEKGFMSLTRTVSSNNKNLYGKTGEVVIENGIEIASKYHPDSTWEAKIYGICTMKDRCPDGSRGVCCLCPHLLFSIMHTEGIVYQHQKTIREIRLVQNKLYDARISGENSARNDLQKKHEELIEELLGWREMMDSIQDQFNSQESIIIDEINSPVQMAKHHVKELYGVMPVTIDQSTAELLLISQKLKYSDLSTDALKKELSHELFINSIQKNDSDARIFLQKLAREGIDWFISRYGALPIEERHKFLQAYITTTIPNIAFNTTNSSPTASEIFLQCTKKL